MSALSIKLQMQRGNIRSIFHSFAGLTFSFRTLLRADKKIYLVSVTATVPSSYSSGDIICHAITMIHATGKQWLPDCSPKPSDDNYTSDGFPIPAWFIGVVLRGSAVARIMMIITHEYRNFFRASTIDYTRWEY